MRQESEILKIPRDLRGMTIADLEPKYGGSWAGTLQRIAREKMDLRQKEEEEKERALKAQEEAIKGKRWVRTSFPSETFLMSGNELEDLPLIRLLVGAARLVSIQFSRG